MKREEATLKTLKVFIEESLSMARSDLSEIENKNSFASGYESGKRDMCKAALACLDGLENPWEAVF